MPTVNHIGVSRRIENEGERTRLKEILDRIRPAGSGGFIVRTAGEERDEEEFRATSSTSPNCGTDQAQAEKASAPTAIHHDLDLVLRTSATFSRRSSERVGDSVDQYQRIVEFLDQIQPNLVSRVRLYRRENQSSTIRIEGEIAKALKSKVG